ncbi:MAG TPA: hypothetical protein VLA92_05070 [Candidatus Saccharimonadales bacterium]|nr:hypothetical protein [Candidatus Saccharimonadales bacterium]
MKKTGERGFTLIELVVTIIFFLSLLILSLFLLRADDYSLITRDSKRRTDVAHLVQVLSRYKADTGELPPGITDKLKAISSGDDHFDICKLIPAKYLKDIPLDPSLGVKAKNNSTEPTRDNCRTDGVTYASGYGIQKNKDGSVEVSAPVAEGGLPIAIELPRSAN